MTDHADTQGHLAWFRNASPYIATHRGRTFVLAFGGEAVDEAGFAALVHDIALLARLGIRLVLVHGSRPQIDARLAAAGIEPEYHGGLRITNTDTLPLVCEATGHTRFTIESMISTGLPGTPMAGTGLRVVGGNYITARPWGVHDGVDFQHTGVVRRVDARGIGRALDDGCIVLLSTLGYSPTGEIFNLHAEDIATETAVALGADKLLFLMERGGVDSGENGVLNQLSPADADRWLTEHPRADTETRRHLHSAVTAVRRGVRRVHLIARTDGALLAELYTRDGTGTMITAETYEGLRAGRTDDVPGILDLITPHEQDGTLVRRSREQLELEADRFVVLERDGAIIGCGALYPQPDGISAEVACVAIHPDYRGDGRGDRLLQRLEHDARERGLQQLFLLSTRTMHWFRERGYEPAEVDALPDERRDLYNWQRNSRIFVKRIQGA
ncbi:MAG: amino-acid N-acetyltransferase [Halofilum sp. (in: g-proteobacteria)]|nr:amino-acid N-acetyltransferase [Halofilum sp. (in: g-proteobacteria)]